MSRSYPSSVLSRARRFGELVRLVRAERGWTQDELASRAGVSQMTVKKIEGGAPGTAFGTILELCSLLGLSPDVDKEPGDLARALRAGIGLPKRVRTKRARPELDV